jgi:hypothetical protein
MSIRHNRRESAHTVFPGSLQRHGAPAIPFIFDHLFDLALSKSQKRKPRQPGIPLNASW